MKLRNLFIVGLLAIAAITTTANAQSYRTAGGLFIDFGDGATLVGPHVKHFFTNQMAGQAAVLFGSGITAISLEGSYNAPIPGAQGLAWNVGIGPQAWIGKNSTVFALRPALGLEYTIPSAPINLGIDWRPAWALSDGSHFSAGHFGLAIRYIFR